MIDNFTMFQVTGFLKQQSQEISKSSLVQQLNIAKSNAAISEVGLSSIDPKQQEIKQVNLLDLIYPKFCVTDVIG